MAPPRRSRTALQREAADAPGALAPAGVWLFRFPLGPAQGEGPVSGVCPRSGTPSAELPPPPSPTCVTNSSGARTRPKGQRSSPSDPFMCCFASANCLEASCSGWAREDQQDVNSNTRKPPKEAPHDTASSNILIFVHIFIIFRINLLPSYQIEPRISLHWTLCQRKDRVLLPHFCIATLICLLGISYGRSSSCKTGEHYYCLASGGRQRTDRAESSAQNEEVSTDALAPSSLFQAPGRFCFSGKGLSLGAATVALSERGGAPEQWVGTC